MSTLLLIRHGQAAFGAQDYDVLSALGAQQSQQLGAHLARRGRAVDAVYVGPRQRHLATWQHLRAGATAGGLALPEATVLAELDEYPFVDILRHAIPLLQADYVRLQSELGVGEPFSHHEGFVRLFPAAIAHWVRGALPQVAESFVAFTERVEAVLSRIAAAHPDRQLVLVITSGGAIGAALRALLGVSDARMLRLSMVFKNAAFCELHYRDGELGVVTFNETPHLAARELHTYR